MLTGRQIVQCYEVEEFCALKDLTTTFNWVDWVGIIGRNGTGSIRLHLGYWGRSYYCVRSARIAAVRPI